MSSIDVIYKLNPITEISKDTIKSYNHLITTLNWNIGCWNTIMGGTKLFPNVFFFIFLTEMKQKFTFSKT